MSTDFPGTGRMVAGTTGQASSPAPPLNRMRLQLQDDTMIRGHTYGILRDAPANPGVRRVDIWNALGQLYNTVHAGGVPWFPANQLMQHLLTAIIQVSKAIHKYPPNGVSGSRNIERATFISKGIEYRVDLENLRGTNLRS